MTQPDQAHETDQSEDAKYILIAKISAAFIVGMFLLSWLFSPGSPASVEAVQTPSAFNTFRVEANRFNQLLQCKSGKITPADAYSGALYGCLKGATPGDEYAKFWINETRGKPGHVANIKVMWNDLNGRVPNDPIHADDLHAADMVRVLATEKVPELKDELAKVFFDTKERKFSSGKFDVEYRWTPGPGIDEHLLILTSRK